MRRISVIALGLVLGSGACLDESETSVGPQFASSAATGEAGTASYRVTVSNLTAGQPLTPPLAAIHRSPVHLFEMGQPASFEVQQIAENGNLDPMIEALGQSQHVDAVVVTQGPTLPPVLPSESVTFVVTGDTGAKYLSIVAMLICTNDGFTGVDAQRLPKRIGDTVTIDAVAYDAGTEMNTEDFADLVPPCAPLTGVASTDSGTGASNPALAEGGIVRVHTGIEGDDDLQVGIHGWDSPVATIEIERIG
ncbi:MAG: spondin domain-containing protein [Gemmatimonadetes bacterium]|nr:spondin domain-containing protein [Gemmatimonadota bacterium]MDA1103894.1 spondin domain-containing protein [Gemmatimonadota bacterium]